MYRRAYGVFLGINRSLIKFRAMRWSPRRTGSRALIYFCVFGADEQFEMLAIALRSLLLFGKSGADVAVVTNEAGYGAVARLLRSLRNGKTCFIIKLVSADTVHEYTSARYRIAEFADLRSYGPVLYLDTDVVIDADISGLLAKIAGSTGVSACPEGRVLHRRDYWGMSIFLKDPSVKVTAETRGFSSGVLGAASVDALATPFRRILEHIKTWHAAGHKPFPVYDQPHAIYTLIKYGDYDGEIMPSHVRIVGNKADADPGTRLGIVHFAGGVGRNDPKLLRMRSYLHAITR